MPSQTVTLSSVAASAPLRITSDMLSTSFLPFGVLCLVSGGGSLTYSVEVTGDDLGAVGYSAATGNWFPMDTMSGLTASANATLGACITGIRARISVYASGTLTAQFVWRSAQS